MKKRSMADLNRISREEFKSTAKLPVILVLDDVRSAYNVGSIFRTADAFHVEGIYLCGISACPPHKDITKTALGATESVDWNYYENAREAILKLKESGYRIFGVEQVDSSISLADFSPEPGVKQAFIFGHEVVGVKEELLALADNCIEIPQFGTKHSFNVTITVGMVLWEISKKIDKNS